MSLLKKNKPLTLGCIARDRTTGIEGVLVNRNELFGGTIQYGVQLPSAAKGDTPPTSYPDAFNIDEGQLEFVKNKIDATPPVHTLIDVGNTVEDKISGFTGIVISKTTFLNGCVYVNVEANRPVTKDEEKTRFVPVQRVKFVGLGLAEAAKPVLEPGPSGEKPTRTGGPVTRSMRAC